MLRGLLVVLGREECWWYPVVLLAVEGGECSWTKVEIGATEAVRLLSGKEGEKKSCLFVLS